MILPKFLATVCCFLLLLQYASGQQVENGLDTFQLAVDQSVGLESAAADSSAAELIIPNVFTPNGDGICDYIEVVTDGTTVYEFSVFTRTGTRIFYSLSPRIFWDGTSSAGIELKEGVYYYVLEEEGDSEPFTSAGFIHLFR